MSSIEVHTDQHHESDEEEEQVEFYSPIKKEWLSKMLAKPGLTWEREGAEIFRGSRDHVLSKKDRKVLQKLIRQGCPTMHRKELWLACSGANSAIKNNPGYYKSLLSSFNSYPNPCFNQIELDLNRTFSESGNKTIVDKCGELRNILCAYVKRNPTVGYCQGLNFIVAHILRYMNEEEAFWILCYIIESLLPLDYYSVMIGVLIDQKLFVRIVKAVMPSLWSKLKTLNLDPSLVSLQWFICLFSYNLQPEVSDVIWDSLFLSGSKILFRSSIAIMSLIEKNIIKCSGFGEAFALLEKEPKALTDVNALIQTMALPKYKFLTNNFINARRAGKWQSTFNELKSTGKRQKRFGRKVEAKFKYLSKLLLYNAHMDNASLISIDKEDGNLRNADMLKCDPEWPVCLFDHTYKTRCLSYFMFRAESPFKIIEDYFPKASAEDEKGAASEELKKGSSNPQEIPSESDTLSGLVVERSHHLCLNTSFIKKLNRILAEAEKHEEAFPLELIDIPIGDERTMQEKIKLFVAHIMEYHNDKNLDEETKEEKKGEEERGIDTGNGKKGIIKELKKEDKTEAGGNKRERIFSGDLHSQDGLERDAFRSRFAQYGQSICVDIRRGPGNREKVLPLKMYLDKVAGKMKLKDSADIVAKSPSGIFVDGMMAGDNTNI